MLVRFEPAYTTMAMNTVFIMSYQDVLGLYRREAVINTGMTEAVKLQGLVAMKYLRILFFLSFDYVCMFQNYKYCGPNLINIVESV